MKAKHCGLLGEKLGHSYSPTIHGMLADYEYRLYEKHKGELGDFIRYGDWDGLNVTIPYKKTVLPYCTELSERAAKIGAVNTLVRMEGGGIFAENTDAYGFEKLIQKTEISVQGKKCLVLGSGGASVMAVSVLKHLGVGEVRVISRNGEDNYGNLGRHADAHVIVNTTPVGMFPNNGETPVDLTCFPSCEAVLDVVYNPSRTALLLQAEERGIAFAGGLYMLVAQAKRSAELFSDTEIPDSEIDRIEHRLRQDMQNIVLIGMPGCGKSTVAAALAKQLGRPVAEADACVEASAGMTIPEIFSRRGEEEFRRLETTALQELGKKSGQIISTGGGCVTKNENYPILHQNGTIIWLLRDAAKLPKDGRPVSLQNDLSELYEKRRPLYERFSDFCVDNNGSVDDTVLAIMEAMK